MPDTATIERPTIPRLPDERPERYAARVEYIVAGPDRSLELVRQKIGKRSARRLELWSAEDDWVAHARRWDDLIVSMRTQAEVDAYRRDLEDHRRRYGDMGKALYQVAARMLRKLDTQVDALEPSAQTLAIASRAVTIAADLEAHALRLADILPKLDTGESE